MSKTWRKSIPDRGNSISEDMEAWGALQVVLPWTSFRVEVEGGEVQGLGEEIRKALVSHMKELSF